MIKKALFTAILLFLIFEVTLRFSDFSWDTAQNDQSSNLISAQNFIYNIDKIEVENDTVLVGSSITKKIPLTKLGDNYINLAFNGWSAYDGLALMLKTGKIPSCILIEKNIVGEAQLAEGIQNSLTPTAILSSKAFQSLQLKNQPVGLLVGSIKAQLKSKIKKLKALKRKNQEAYDENVLRNVEKQQNSLDDSEYVNRFTKLEELITELRQNGAAIVFFEVPMDGRLTYTPMRKKQREFFLSYFPENKYNHLSLPSSENYIFSDGTHLSEESAEDFSEFMLNELKRLPK